MIQCIIAILAWAIVSVSELGFQALQLNNGIIDLHRALSFKTHQD